MVHKPGCMWETAVPKDDQHTSHGLVGRRQAVDLAVPGSSPGGCISTGAATACGRRGIQRWQPVDWRASSVKFRLLKIDASSGQPAAHRNMGPHRHIMSAGPPEWCSGDRVGPALLLCMLEYTCIISVPGQPMRGDLIQAGTSRVGHRQRGDSNPCGQSPLDF